MIAVITLVLLAGGLLYRYLKQNYSLFEKDEIPGPKPIFVFGNLGEFAKKNPIDTFSEWARKYGKVYGYYEGLQPSILITDPDLIEQILVKQFYLFDGRPPFWPFMYGAEHIALPHLHGALWKRHRDVVASSFKTGNIRKMWPRLHEASKRYIDNLRNSELENPGGFPISVENETYCFESFTSACLDIEIDSLASEDRNRLHDYVLALHRSTAPENFGSGLSRTYRMLAPFFKLFDWEHKRRAYDFFHCISKLLQKERQQMGSTQTPTNLLQHFLAARCATKENSNNKDTTTNNNDNTTINNNNTMYTALSEEEIQAMMVSLFSGGLGPTSSCLDFTVYCMALYPEKQERLREEVLQACGEDGPLEMDRVQSIEYLDMFISEVLRHYPVAPGVARTCSEDCVVKGVQFRKDTAVRLMASVMYMDPDIYPEPKEFRPERFCKEEREKRHPFSYFPFGSGPRMCVAKRLGLLQVKLATAQLVRHFHVHKSSLTQLPLQVALRPFLCPKDDVHVKLVPRDIDQQ